MFVQSFAYFFVCAFIQSFGFDSLCAYAYYPAPGHVFYVRFDLFGLSICLLCVVLGSTKKSYKTIFALFLIAFYHSRHTNPQSKKISFLILIYGYMIKQNNIPFI